MSERHDSSRPVTIPGLELHGRLGIPQGAGAVVLFAHGSGSSHRSPRNNRVAEVLRKLGLGTFLFDLLSEREARDRRQVFDIELLAARLSAATEWLLAQPSAVGLQAGFFGASTGAAAALVAETFCPREIGAIVSRGGRPDLASSALGRVRAPTLLIVGGADPEVLALNRLALAQLRCEKRLEVVAGATHLFEEPGTLEQVTELAGRWFLEHLAGGEG